MLERCLDLLEDLVYEAVGVEECFNPAEYEISAEIVQRANQILADYARSRRGFPALDPKTRATLYEGRPGPGVGDRLEKRISPGSRDRSIPGPVGTG